MPQVVRALRNPNFRLFWSGNFLSNIGTWMQNVAQGWLVLTLTSNSAFWLGVVGFAGSIPFLCFSLFGGVVADRVDKRKLLLFTQSAMMILAFLLAALAYFNVITVWEVALIAFLNGTAMSLKRAQLPGAGAQLVQREDLTNAIALNAAQYNMSRILGPTLGGYAMALLGVAGNFFLNGLSFLAVLFALTRIRYPEQKPARRESMWGQLARRFQLCAQPSANVRAGGHDRRFQPADHALSYLHSLLCARATGHPTPAAWAGSSARPAREAVLAAITVASLGNVRHRGWVIACAGMGVMASW